MKRPPRIEIKPMTRVEPSAELAGFVRDMAAFAAMVGFIISMSVLLMAVYLPTPTV
jgi:hypothetical protein